MIEQSKEIIKHKEVTLQAINDYLDNQIKSDPKKTNKLLYWMTDYINFLKREEQFKPSSLRKYKRGEIVKAHLGYKIGNEEGGLHYCVVVENENSIHSGIITVVPLTSLKMGKDKLRKYEVFLGDDLSKKILQKCNGIATEMLNNMALAEKNNDTELLNNELSKRDLVQKIKNELLKMKKGSIALVSQVTTISKLRIYDPQTNNDVLSNIKLSNENLDKIDKVIKEMFVKN